MDEVKSERIARICHEANRAYCLSIGDLSQTLWDDATAVQREALIFGVEYALCHPEVTVSEQHAAWMRDKLALGWQWGPVKDDAEKRHPYLMPYGELPHEQRMKDWLFQGIVQVFVNCDAGGHHV